MERTNPKGYYTENINFSVEFYNSAWIMRCRFQQDELAKTQEQKDAIDYWINSNRLKYEEAKAEREWQPLIPGIVWRKTHDKRYLR